MCVRQTRLYFVEWKHNMATQDLTLAIYTPTNNRLRNSVHGQNYNILRFSGCSYYCGASSHIEHLLFRHRERNLAALTIQTNTRRWLATKLRDRRLSAILLIQYRLRKWSREQLVPGGKLAQQAEERYYQV